MNISRHEQRALRVLALGGRILHERVYCPKITSVMCVTREGMVLTLFNRLHRKRLVESRSGGPHIRPRSTRQSRGMIC